MQSGLTAGRGNGTNSPLQSRNALFKNRIGWVANSAVDMTATL
jgi:hypothetical protein